MVRAPTVRRSLTCPISATTIAVRVIDTVITIFRPNRSASQPPAAFEKIEQIE